MLRRWPRLGKTRQRPESPGACGADASSQATHESKPDGGTHSELDGKDPGSDSLMENKYDRDAILDAREYRLREKEKQLRELEEGLKKKACPRYIEFSHPLLQFVAAPMMDASTNEWSLPRAERPFWKKRAEEAIALVLSSQEKKIPITDVVRMLAGDFLGPVPVSRKHPVIRPFFSGTFTDTNCERELLALDVYPFLKQFAQDLGVTFYEPVEMRWGKGVGVQNMSNSANMCHQEISRCQRESDGISLIVLLGDRYGSRFLPTTITVEAFESLLVSLTDEPELKQLLCEWFEVDSNPSRPVYRIRPAEEVERVLRSFSRGRHLTPELMANGVVSPDGQDLSAPQQDVNRFWTEVACRIQDALHRTRGDRKIHRPNDEKDYPSNLDDPTEGHVDARTRGDMKEQECRNSPARWAWTGSNALLSPRVQAKKADYQSYSNGEFGKEMGGSAQVSESPEVRIDAATLPDFFGGEGESTSGEVEAKSEPDLSEYVTDALFKDLLSHVSSSGWEDTAAADPDEACVNCLDCFGASATEAEVHRGLLSNPEPNKRCFVFSRSIRDLGSCVGDAVAANYVDMRPTGDVDYLAMRRLRDLKECIISDAIDPSRTLTYTVEWGPGINSDTHEEYLRTFCDDFCAVFTDDILETALRFRLERDEIYDECVSHFMFARKRCSCVVDTEEVAGVTRSILKAFQVQYPAVLYGPSGSGKTTAMALTALATRKILGFTAADLVTGQPKDLRAVSCLAEVTSPVVITRFIGTSRYTGTVRDLLHSLCSHLLRIYPDDDNSATVSSSYPVLVKLFSALLQRATAQRPLYLFLDGVDELTEGDHAWSLDWLPLSLSEHSHIVVSVNDDKPCKCFEVLVRRMRFELPVPVFIPVGASKSLDAESTVAFWLKQSDRSLTPSQQRRLVAAPPECPLYLRVAFDASKPWRSSDPIPHGPLPTLPQLITLLLAKMESVHGKKLVSAAVGFLCVTRVGLADLEMEDLLSCDDVVLDDVFEFWSPPIRRLPSLLWHRVKVDIGDYLVLHGVDGGTPVMRFHHREFRRNASAKYLHCADERVARHSALGDYFSGRWAGCEKPYGPNGMYRADRKVSPQPLVMHGDLGMHGCALNLRKLSEEVYNRLASGEFTKLDTTLGSLEYVWAKCLAEQVDDLVRDYVIFGNAQRRAKDSKVLRVLECGYFVRANSHILRTRPNLIIQRAINDPDFGEVCSMGRRLEEEYQMAAGVYCRWLNKLQYKNPMVLTITGHDDAVWKATFSPDSTKIASASDDCTVRIFDAVTGRMLHRFVAGEKKSSACTWSPDGNLLISGGQDSKLCVWDANAGESLYCLDTHGWVTSCAYSPDGRIVAVGTSFEFYLFETTHWTEVCRLKGHSKSVRGCAFSGDGKSLVSASADQTVRLWDVTDPTDATKVRELHCWDDHKELISSCAFAPNNRWVASASSDAFCNVYDVRSKKKVAAVTNSLGKMCCCAFSPDSSMFICGGGGIKALEIFSTKDWTGLGVLRGHSDVIWGCSLSPDGSQILSCGGTLDKTIRVWDTETSLKCGTPPGHATICREVYWHPSGNKVLSCGDDRIVQLTRIDTGEVVMQLKHSTAKVSSAAISYDGKYIVGGGADTLLRLWDATTGELLHFVEEHPKPILSCTFSHNSLLVLTSGNGFVAYAWELHRGRLKKLKKITLENAGFSSQFSPDDAMVVIRNSADDMAVFDTKQWTLRCRFRTHPVFAWFNVFSPDGRTIAAACSDGVIRMYDATNIPLTGNPVPVPREPIRHLHGHATTVKSVGYSRDGRYLVSGSDDKSVRVWDTSTYEQIAFFPALGAIQTVSFSPDCMHIAAGDFGGVLYILRLMNLPSTKGGRKSIRRTIVSPALARGSQLETAAQRPGSAAQAEHGRNIKNGDSTLGPPKAANVDSPEPTGGESSGSRQTQRHHSHHSQQEPVHYQHFDLHKYPQESLNSSPQRSSPVQKQPNLAPHEPTPQQQLPVPSLEALSRSPGRDGGGPAVSIQEKDAQSADGDSATGTPASIRQDLPPELPSAHDYAMFSPDASNTRPLSASVPNTFHMPQSADDDAPPSAPRSRSSPGWATE
eukprot:Rmarinus@m.21807